METWHVYQLRSDTELLYVGYTRRLKRRLGAHRREKAWWPEVTQTRSEQFSTEGDARQREKEIWSDECPKYNRQTPFLTDEEFTAVTRERVRLWVLAHPERAREYQKKYVANPANRAAIRAYRRDWDRRNRPTTAAGRRIGRWQQSGPSLFD